jgi:alanine racemase
MDMTTVDISGLSVQIGDCATFLGVDGTNSMWADSVARSANMIPYEVLTGYHGRICRVFAR